MRLYTQKHRHYCGIDLHARSMYICVLSQSGEPVLHKNMITAPEPFLKAIAPFRDDLVVAVECISPGIGLLISVPGRRLHSFLVTPYT
jgi:predicted NBD/HSP70 family sugar kinase